MKLLFTLCTLFACGNYVFAQDSLITLDPSVGDTISLDEKMKYVLFENHDNVDFKYAVIRHNATGNSVYFQYASKEYLLPIDDKKLDECRQNIAILNAYHAKDENSTMIKKSNSTQQINKNYMTDEMKQKLIIESRNYVDLRNEADRLGLRGQNREKYMSGGGRFQIELDPK